MYGAHDDPYVYPGTHVLINSENIKDAARLADFELEVVTVREALAIFDASEWRETLEDLADYVVERIN